jgi:hypothetical protein
MNSPLEVLSSLIGKRFGLVFFTIRALLVVAFSPNIDEVQ